MTNDIQQSKQLRKYIRDDRRNPIGVIVAEKHDEEILFGWSLCSVKDRFNKEHGLRIAMGRLLNGSNIKLLRLVEEYLPRFKERVTKYFQASTPASVPVEKTSSMT